LWDDRWDFGTGKAIQILDDQHRAVRNTTVLDRSPESTERPLRDVFLMTGRKSLIAQREQRIECEATFRSPAGGAFYLSICAAAAGLPWVAGTHITANTR
jgi:hypothetical protein